MLEVTQVENPNAKPVRLKVEDSVRTGEQLKQVIAARFPKEAACIDDPKTDRRLTQMLQFAVENHIRVSTPQFYLDGQRLCDEDSDLGLSYALRRLAPEVLP